MRSETCRKGEIAKCAVLKRAYEKGVVVSIPTIDADYDALLDVGGRFVRAQIKYVDGKVSHSTGSVFLGLRRTTRNGKVLVYSRDDIDIILAYLPSIDAVLWLPCELWEGKTSVTIRTHSTKNNQKSGVVLAHDLMW